MDFWAGNNHIFLSDINGKDYLVDSNLTDLETKLPKDFIRVHKSTIVNSKLIAEVKKLANGRYDLVMKCNKERIIQCSKNYNDKIKSIIDFNLKSQNLIDSGFKKEFNKIIRILRSHMIYM